MSRADSKSPNIAFDSDSASESDDEQDSVMAASPLLAPTPTLSERLKRANQELLSHPSPPNSRASRIGFRDEDDVKEYNDDDQPKQVEVSPLIREPNLVDREMPKEDSLPNESKTELEQEYPPDFEEEHVDVAIIEKPKSPSPVQNEEITPAVTPVATPTATPVATPVANENIHTETDVSVSAEQSDTIKITGKNASPDSSLNETESDSVLVEENGHFRMTETETDKSSYSDDGRMSAQTLDYNADYKSPYALTDAQKNMGRQRQVAKMRRLKAEEELKRVEVEEQKDDNESSFEAWLQRKKEENKSAKQDHRKQKLNSSKMMNEQATPDERNEIWSEWLSQKDKQHRQQRIIEHQMEIEKMEGLYVRSRQENDKAFRKWKKKKVIEAQNEQQQHWQQVQISKAELRAIRQNQKRASIINAAKVASALEFF